MLGNTGQFQEDPRPLILCFVGILRESYLNSEKSPGRPGRDKM